MRIMLVVAAGMLIIMMALNANVEPTESIENTVPAPTAEAPGDAPGADSDPQTPVATPSGPMTGSPTPVAPIQASPTEPLPDQGIQVRLWAAHTTDSWDERDPNRDRFELPLLYLRRERAATAAAERTLHISLSGIGGGSEIQIELTSRHKDVSTFRPHTLTQRFGLPSHPCTVADPCTVSWTFDPASTHSDFYTLRVTDPAGKELWTNGSAERPDFVILDTWDVVSGEYTVRVTYATLFPFARGSHDLDNRLRPDEVTDFVEGHFVPIIHDTWHTQPKTWGFGEPFHPDWDPDTVVEIIITDPPFALLGGTGTNTVFAYTDGQLYPQRRIWWFSANDAFRAYDSLENAYRAVFAHEFFHLAQWNVVLSAGCSPNRWTNVFIEAQGKFAPSVQHPDTEITSSRIANVGSEYADAADRYLSHRLNSSYRDMESEGKFLYDAALYWRFLYEQFNDMQVIRAALEEMACHHDPDILVSLEEVMNRTFDRFDGPFRTFEDSLIAFGRANYGLRLENGRCAAADPAQCGGFYYDPAGIYKRPPLEAELAYDGAALSYDGGIPSSFGTDFVEVHLDPVATGRPLTVKVQAEGPVSRFNVEIWKLSSGASGSRWVAPQPEIVPQNQDGVHAYTISNLDGTNNRLAVIITRLDGDESTDSAGAYHITLTSEAHFGG